MASFLLCFVLIFAALAGVVRPATADSYKDCMQSSDPDREIRGCTALLAKKTESKHTFAVAYNNRGYAYAQKGEYEHALADLGRAIELDPQYAEAYNNRAFVYLKAGMAADGLPDAGLALRLRPGYADALDTRGHIFEALGKREDAIVDFRAALAKDPDLQSSKDALKRLRAEP
jgi:tetratricopeptide (TPR) repeat protein